MEAGTVLSELAGQSKRLSAERSISMVRSCFMLLHLHTTIKHSISTPILSADFKRGNTNVSQGVSFSIVL